MPEWMGQIDASFFSFLNHDCRNGFFDLTMPFITSRSYLLILPFLAFFLRKERKKALAVAVIALLSFGLSDALSNTLKHLFERQRPCNVLENVHLLVGCTKSFSMPSNHAANAFAFAVPFLLMTRSRLRYVFLSVAILVAFSRISVGVHYPSDVLAGALLGSLVSIALTVSYRRAERSFPLRPVSVMYAFLLALSLFRILYILFGPLDLGPDEAHYWEWSRRPDLSYYSKGPMIAYLIRASTSVFGDNVFGVRILAVAFSVLSSIFLYRLGKEMYGERTGAASAMLLQIIPLFSPFGVIFTIDSPFIFFWILSLYLFWKAVNPHKYQSIKGSKGQSEGNSDTRTFCHSDTLTLGGSDARTWFLLGLSTGLGLLTKYTMAFFYVCAFLFLLFSPRRRRFLGSAGPYVSVVGGVVVFSPVLLWNYLHDWVTVRHTAGQAHVAEGLRISLKSFFEFIGSQIGALTPILFVMMIIALWRMRGAQGAGNEAHIPVIASPEPAVSETSRLLRSARNDKSEGARNDEAGDRGDLLFWFSIPVIGFFLLKSLQGKVQANWPMTGYITGIIAFSETFISRWKEMRSPAKTAATIAIALSLFVTAAAHYPSKFHIPVKLDPSSRLRGWRQLGREVSAVHRDMSGKGKVFIFSDSYQAASELAFYVEGRPVTYCANFGRRMNQYDLWPDFYDLVHYDGIFVTIGDTALHPDVRNAFQGCEKRLLTVREGERSLRDYSVFTCRDFRGTGKEAIRSY